MDTLKENQISIKNFYIPLIYIISAIILEMGTFIALRFGILPTYFLLDLSIIMILFAIMFFIPNKIAQMVLTIILLLAHSVLSYINVTLYNIYGDLFSFDMIVLGGEAFKSFDPSFLNYGFLSFLIILFTTSVVLMSKSLKNKINFHIGKRALISMSLTFLITLSLGFGGYNLQLAILPYSNNINYDTYFNNDKNLYQTQYIKSESLKKFGTFGFYIKNIGNMLSHNEIDNNEIEKTKDYIKNGSYNKINDKTALLQNDNLVVVMCESLEWYGIDEILTPTLYELFYNGTALTNYISKSKTNYSEMDCILGSVPSNNSFTNGFHGTSSNLLENYLPLSLPNKFRDAGYTSNNFFHDNVGSFYARNQTHKTFGFDKVITLDEMTFDCGIDHTVRFQRDSDMVKSCINDIAPVDKKFTSFITTVTTHGPYKGNHLLNKYYEKLTDEVFNDYLIRLSHDKRFILPTKDNEFLVRNYIASCMDLDYAMEILVKHLKDNNILDNTTLILYADHNAYFHGLSYEMRGVNKKHYYEPTLYRVPATIYSSKMGKGSIEDFTCPYNLLPTIFDLFGIQFNTNLYMAPSIFSEDFKNTIFISQIGGILTLDLYSDNVKDLKIINENVTEEEKLNFKKNAFNFYDKQNMMNNIYNLDLFNKDESLLNYI